MFYSRRRATAHFTYKITFQHAISARSLTVEEKYSLFIYSKFLVQGRELSRFMSIILREVTGLSLQREKLPWDFVRFTVQC
jgi:hypothetical protein